MTRRNTFADWDLNERDRFATAARSADWPAVFAKLTENPALVNAWRPGGSSWYTPTHQAAWHGASVPVVQRLLEYLPWRTLRTSSGDRAADIAERGGHAEIAALLRPRVLHPVPTDVLARLEHNLHGVIRERVGHLIDELGLRLPVLDVLTELADPAIHFPVSGMYGGFTIWLEGEELSVESWMRVVEGSGQRHRVRATGVQLVEDGFV